MLEDVEISEPGDYEIMIKFHAASLNFRDLMIAEVLPMMSRDRLSKDVYLTSLGDIYVEDYGQGCSGVSIMLFHRGQSRLIKSYAEYGPALMPLAKSSKWDQRPHASVSVRGFHPFFT